MRKAYPDLIGWARGMRSAMTAAEAALWAELRSRRMGKWRRQHPIGGYILDFYCAAARLCLEVDGGGHQTKGQQERDAARTAALLARGIRTLRFDNHDVLLNMESVLTHIQRALAAPPYPLPPAGEGGAPAGRAG